MQALNVKNNARLATCTMGVVLTLQSEFASYGQEIKWQTFKWMEQDKH